MQPTLTGLAYTDASVETPTPFGVAFVGPTDEHYVWGKGTRKGERPVDRQVLDLYRGRSPRPRRRTRLRRQGRGPLPVLTVNTRDLRDQGGPSAPLSWPRRRRDAGHLAARCVERQAGALDAPCISASGSHVNAHEQRAIPKLVFDFSRPQSRAERIARLDALANLLDTAFILPEPTSASASMPSSASFPESATRSPRVMSLYIVREARALGAPAT